VPACRRAVAEGGRGVPGPEGAQGTFSWFSESESSKRPMPTATNPDGSGSALVTAISLWWNLWHEGTKSGVNQ
jgi:hypothetical protein